MALVSLVSGCQSLPTSNVSLPSESSLLALDVVFPEALSRDPDLVQVYFVRGPIHAGLDELPDLIPASFVKWSRAYLLDPEPGTYSVVAVTAAYAPPWNDYRIAGVTKTTWSRTSSDAMIFPAELIHTTITTIGPGRVEYIGTLRIGRGERIDAESAFQDDLQRRIAQYLRPGVASKTGFAGWLERTRMVDLEATSIDRGAAEREAFFESAPADLDESPWAEVIARAAVPEDTPGRTSVASRAPKPRVEAPVAVAATPPPVVAATRRRGALAG